MIEYKAKLKGIKTVFVNPAFTPSLCPICGGLKPEWAQLFS
ncbi:transposase [Methanothermococcus sp. SCGC AD-155-E23]|nr:transposase [Methanothermococcus sp. SCGC AD-155-E23]